MASTIPGTLLRALPLLAALLLAGCGGLQSDLAEQPAMEPGRENPDLPGVFSGPQGAFVIERRID